MPAHAPAAATAIAHLSVIGERIRRHRKSLPVSAVNAAEAAGISRVTLHRIERGEPSVTMGAYLNAIEALGLELDVFDRQRAGEAASAVPAAKGAPLRIHLDDYPQLKRLAWQVRSSVELTDEEALGLYERNWRHVDTQAMDARERELVNRLVAGIGKGRLLV